MITDRQVQKIIREAAASGKKSIELKDPGERGAGRLAIIIRPSAERTSAEWYAIYYAAGARKMAKLGSYPAIGVAEARRTFATDWAPKIAAGENPAMQRRQASAAGTVADLFAAYVAHLLANGKRSAKQVAKYLEVAGADIGADKPAASITPDDIVPHLAAIHNRGAVAYANLARAYISAAFSFGLKSEHDFTRKRTGGWGLKSNPAAVIPANRAARRVGNRYLSTQEIRTFWLWLLKQRHDSLAAFALLLRISTGQRSEEILKIATPKGAKGRDDLAIYEAASGCLYFPKTKNGLHFPKTKNGLPHSIPLPRQAVAVLDAMIPNKHGLYFPNQYDPKRSAVYQSLGQAIDKCLRENPGFESFTAKDIRRTWKTQAGAAGVSKEMRDRLQNHTKSDVSSKHYDRYEYLPERRAAMDKWADYLDRVIAGTVDAPSGNVVPVRPEVAV